MTDLNARLLAAHERDDKPELVRLYRLAADQTDDTDAEAFYLTYAYVFALELGHPGATALHARLKDMGRES